MITQEDIDEIEAYCQWEEGTIYLLTAMARKRENPDISHNMEKMMRMEARDEKGLRQKLPELIARTEEHEETFRIYISINRRNTMDAMFILRERMEKWLHQAMQGNDEIRHKFDRIGSEWKSCLQEDGCRHDNYFLFDLDDPEPAADGTMRALLEDHTEILLHRETPNGHHFITRGFNHNNINTPIDYELKFDAMTFIGYA